MQIFIVYKRSVWSVIANLTTDVLVMIVLLLWYDYTEQLELTGKLKHFLANMFQH